MNHPNEIKKKSNNQFEIRKMMQLKELLIVNERKYNIDRNFQEQLNAHKKME